MNICNLDANKELGNAVASTINLSIKQSIEANSQYKVLKDALNIYESVYKNTKDQNKALGVAAAVPEMFLKVLVSNPSYLNALLENGVKIDEIKKLNDEILNSKAPLDLISTKLNIKKNVSINTILSNVVPDYEEAPEYKRVTDSGIAIINKLLNSLSFFNTTINERKIVNGVAIENITDENKSLFGNVIKKLLTDKNNNDEIEPFNDLKLKALYQNNLPDYEKNNIAKVPIILAITDNKGNFLYFKNDGTLTTKENGKIAYSFLKDMGDKNVTTLVNQSLDVLKSRLYNNIKQDNIDLNEETILQLLEKEIIGAEKSFREKFTEQREQLLDINKKLQNAQNVLLPITGGIKGFTTNIDTLSAKEKKDLIKPLEEYKLSEEEERSIKLSEQTTKDNMVITKLGIQFDNLPGVTDFTQTAILENQELLDNIADVLFDPLTFKDGAIITPNQRKDYLRQFLFINRKILETVIINDDLQFINVKKNKIIESKEEFKELVKNTKIKFDKALYTNNEYSEYKINNNIITETKLRYKPFIFKFYKPNVVFDLTTKSAMVINGYLSFIVPEVGTIVEEKTPEVKKLEKEIKDDYEDLNRSLLLKNHATAEQNEKAKNWWKKSALSKAVDSKGNPLFTLTFLQNIANSDAWANFRDSTITLYKGSNYTDVYHEAWHAFSQLYLTKPERTVLYDKIGALPGSFTVIRKITSGGVTNSSKVSVKFSDATRKEKEEFIAEEFRIYAKNNGKFKVETQKNSFLKRLFDKIWKALKALVGNVEEFSNPGSQGILSDIFNTLYSAETAEALNLYTPTIENVEFGSLNSGIIIEDKVILSASDADWISRSIDGLIGKRINLFMKSKEEVDSNNYTPGKVGAITKLLKGDKNLTLLYDYIKNELIDKLNELEKEYSEEEKSWTQLEKDIKKNRITILDETLKNYGDIASILKGETSKNSTVIQYHRNNSVFKEELGTVIPSEKTADRGINDTNSFDLADDITKLLISSLLKQKQGAEDDEYELNELGFPETIDFKSFWNLLMNKVSGKKTVTGMYQKLIKAADNKKNSPLFKQLLNRIGLPTDMNEKNANERETSPDIWIGLAQSLSLSKVDIFSSTINKKEVKNDNDSFKTVYEFKPGVTSKETYKIKKDWISKFIQEKSTDANYILKNKSNESYLNLPKIIKDFYTKETNKNKENIVVYRLKNNVDIIKFFNSLGIYLDDNADIKNNMDALGVSYIANAIGQAAFNNQEITNILSHFNKKIKNIKVQKIENDVITILNSNIEPLYTRFEDLTQLQATYSDTYASTMGKSADNENKSVYALTNSNIMLSEALNEISKLGDAYNAEGDYKHLNHLNPKNNPAMKFSVIMKSLFDIDGKKRKGAAIKWVDISGSQFIIENSTEQEGKTQADMYKSDKFISDLLTYLKTGVIEYIRNGDKKTFLAPQVDLITYDNKKNKNLFIDTSAFLVDNFGKKILINGIDPNVQFLKLIYDKLEGELRRIKMIKADPEYYNNIKYFANADKLTFFDAILESKEYGSDIKNELTSDAFLNLLKDDTNIYDALNAYTSDKKTINKNTIDKEILSYFDIETERLKNAFDDIFSHDTTIINGLLKDIVYSELKENDINNLPELGTDAIKNAALRSFTYNTWLNSAELTTLYLSDNFQFDHDKDDETKRVAPYQSGGRMFFYDNVVLTYINEKLRRPYEEELIKKGLLIKKEARTDYDGTVNTSIIRESIIRSRYYNMYNEYFTNVIRKQTPGITQDEINIKLYGEKGTVDKPKGGYMLPYFKIKNGDGQGWISFDMYRILKKSEYAWSNAQENLYQKIIKNEDVSSIDVTEFFPVYKLQYAGPLATEKGRYPVQSVDKFSLMPLIPNVFKDAALEQLHLAMMSQNIDYTLFESGAKRAYIKKNPDSNGDLIYGESIKTQISTNPRDPIEEYLETDTSKIFKYTDIELTNNKKYVAYLKNQTEINSIDKGSSTLSTQMRKIFNLGLYAQGYPIDFEGSIKEWKALSETAKLEKSGIHKKCESLYNKLERWTSIEKAELLENMGLIESYDSENKTYTITPKNNDISDFINFIQKELVKQDYSPEELAILNNKTGSTIDISISPFASRIEKALTALINNRLVKLKSKGAALVEVSSTFTPKWKNPTEEDIKKYRNDDLPSYVVDIDGKENTTGCGVKIAITDNYENLYKTAFFIQNDKNEYVKSKETIGVYDEIINPETKKTQKVLNQQKSFIRLNQMIRVQEWKNDSENRKKIQIAGVRIPTQGPNSIEFAEIFEFLPASAGNIIIIPSEIVAKSGTDFDVDKLTTYIKYINKFGDLLKDTYKSKEDINVVIKDLEAKKKQLLALQTTITDKKAQGFAITDNLADFRKKIRDLNFNKNIGKDTLRLFTQTDNKILLTTLNNKENQNYLKENLKEAYSIYEKEIKGFDVKDLESINEELQALYKETTPFSKVFRELSAAKEQKRNFINGIQNDFIDDLISIMQMPEMAFSLLQANDTHIAKPYSDELKPVIQENDNEINYNIYSKTGKQVSDNKNAISPSYALSYLYNLRKHQDNKSGKESLGVGALDNPINNILNILGTTLKGSAEVTITELDANKNEILKKVNVPIDLKLNVNYTVEVDKALKEINVISLSNLTDSEKNNNIGEVISQLMNGFVDVGKDNWVSYIQGNLKTVPTILFLLQTGVPLGDVVYFVTNPMIRNYTKEVSKQESLFSELIYGSNHTKDFAKSQAKDFLYLRLQELTKLGILSIEELQEFKRNTRGRKDIVKSSFYAYHKLLNILKPDNFTTAQLKKIAYSKEVPKFIKDGDQNGLLKGQLAGFIQYLYIEQIVQEFDFVKNNMKPDTNVSTTSIVALKKDKNLKKGENLEYFNANVTQDVQKSGPIYSFYIQNLIKNILTNAFKFRNNSKIMDFLLKSTDTPKERGDIKEKTGYDEDTYYNKYLNAFMQYIFTNSLKKYKSKDVDYNQKKISDLIDIEQVKADFTEGTWKEKGDLNQYTFNAKQLNDFIEFNLERASLKSNQPLNDVFKKTNLFVQKKQIMQSVFAKGETESVEDYESRIDNTVYDNIMNNQALHNTYNNYALFRGDNSIASVLLNIINTYKLDEKYSILRQFSASTTDEKIRNFKLNNGIEVSDNATLKSDYNKQLRDLADPSINKITINNETDRINNNYINNFFDQLPIISFLQSGMDSSEYNLMAVMPDAKYLDTMQKGVESISELAKKENFSHILQGFQKLFLQKHDIKNKKFRSRGLDYNKSLTGLLDLIEYYKYDITKQPFIEERSENTFILHDKYTIEGKKGINVVSDKKIKELKDNNPEVVFLLTNEDLGITTIPNTKEELDALSIALEQRIQAIKASGKKVVLSSKGFGSKNQTIEQSSNGVNPSDFTNYHGGAKKYDTYWEQDGKNIGVTKHIVYTTDSYDKLDQTTKDKLESRYEAARTWLGRGVLARNTYNGKLVRRDMMQAAKADAIFGISEIVAPGVKGRLGYVNKLNHPVIEGGTGYAAASAILQGKPVYIFNQDSNYGFPIGWYEWNNASNTFIKTKTPSLTKNFAGIGDHVYETEVGKQAIKNVYKKTFTQPTESSTSVERTDKIVLRSELKANPTTLYLFGDNDIRKGLGGQAKEMRGEPNAIGVSTKKLPASGEEAYKSDVELEKNRKIITDDINKAIAEWNTGKYNKLIIPQMGVGLAELPTRAPETYKFLQQELKRLEDQVTQLSTSVKPTIDLSKEWSKDLESRRVYTKEGVNTMRTTAAKPNEHFGNPFSEAGYGGTIKVPSIGAAVVAYKEWLTTDKYDFDEPLKPMGNSEFNKFYTQIKKMSGSNNNNVQENFASNYLLDLLNRKKWILNQINQGKLDSATLLYAGKSEARGQGMHPTALAEVVEQLRTTQSSIENNKLYQESGSLTTLSQSKIDNLQNTIEYQLLNEKDEDLDKKVGQSYIFLSEKDAKRFSFVLEKNKEFPKEFKVTKKITKYERDTKNKLKFNGYNEYVDYYYIKSNKNKKSNLYDIVNKETGEIIATKVRVLSISKDSKSEIAKKYGLEFTPTKIFSANRSVAFALYRQKPSKAKYIAQAKKYLYDALKFLNPEETNLKINLDKIETFLDSFPNEMWDYINTTYSPEDSTNINASIALQNKIKFELPKLGLLTEIEKITGIPLQGVSFRNYDRSGMIKKLGFNWKELVTIDHTKFSAKKLKKLIAYYLNSKGYFKSSSEEENVRKYAEHRNIDYNELKELVFGDLDKALNNIAYNTTGNSDTIELSKWRESIRNYNWQSVELFAKPYENFQNTVKDRITAKFKDKTLSNNISHLDYFFSGDFNWLNINFNNISGQYLESDMETKADTGFDVKMVGFANPFELKTYKKPKPGKNFLEEKEVFNRLAAILHEPFHALHALSYGTQEELQLRKSFDNLYNTDFGKQMMDQVFGSGYNNGQQISYNTLYKEFTAFTTQLMLYPKQWINKTDLRSNDIADFIAKIQSLQDKTYNEIVKTEGKVGTTETIKTEEEKIKLTYLEKLYNYSIKALNKVITISKNFTSLIADSKLVDKKVIEDVFGTVEESVNKTLKLPENVKKSKEEFLQAMEELQSAINTLMQIDSKLFSSENITNFFTSDKFNQEENVKNNNDYNRAFNLTLNESLKENLDYSNPGSENATVSDIITRMPLINNKEINDKKEEC